jgi:hypothetical protein
VALGEDEPGVTGQQGAGILELVSRIGARLPDEEMVQFVRPGFGDAVLDYFWIDRQHLRTEFLEWMCNLPVTSDGAAGKLVTERIVAYALRWTKQHGDLKFLQEVAKLWAPAESLRPTAGQLLTAAAMDPKVGKRVRDRLLAWAKGEYSSTSAMRALVADVCGGALARLYPKMMLLRLSYLAQNADPTVTQAVKNAMRNLWQQPDSRELVLAQVAEWCASDDAGPRQAGLHSFLALAAMRDDWRHAPTLLSPNGDQLIPIHNQMVTRGWQTVFESSLTEQLAGDVLAQWLDAAASSPQLRVQVIRDLTAGVQGTDPTLGGSSRFVRLTRLLYGWQPNQQGADARRTELRDSLIEQLSNAAQTRPSMLVANVTDTNEAAADPQINV